MGTTVLGQWVDVSQRLHVLHQHLTALKRVVNADPVVPPHYVAECNRLIHELTGIEQEVSYLNETLLQALAVME